MSCKAGVPPLAGEDLHKLHEALGGFGSDWEVVDEHHLHKTYRFANFQEALDFTNRVGALAEEQNHHPDIELAWGRVSLSIFTHTIDGLSESDFVWAAKADRCL